MPKLIFSIYIQCRLIRIESNELEVFETQFPTRVAYPLSGDSETKIWVGVLMDYFGYRTGQAVVERNVCT